MNHAKQKISYRFRRQAVNICGFLVLIFFLAGFAAAQQNQRPQPEKKNASPDNSKNSNSADFSQDDETYPVIPANEEEAFVMKFVRCYKETDGWRRAACYAFAKDFLDKHSGNDQYTAFVRKKYDAYAADKTKNELFERFDNALKKTKGVDADEVFSTGKEIITANPDLIDVPIVLASIGFENASAASPNDKYNVEAIDYAKMVIDKINAGKNCNFCGAYDQKYPDGENNALGLMNYYIGFIMYNRQNMKKEALPYLYKATQAKSETKNTSEIYRLIGLWYADEFLRLDTDRREKIKAAGDRDTNETKAILTMEKACAERASDACARAYKLALPTAAKEYKDALLARAKQFYGIRFYGDPAKTKGFENFAAAAVNKPFADPATVNGN